MKLSHILTHDSGKLRKIDFLPNSFKPIGGIILAISILLGIITTAGGYATPFLKTTVFNGVIIGMLLISVSKDKEEDEYTIQLKARSYALAFVCGILYAIIQPYINFYVAKVVTSNEVEFNTMGSLIVVWFMLFVQIGFYYTMKMSR